MNILKFNGDYAILLFSIVAALFSGACNSTEDSKDWPYYLGDKSVSHYSGLNQIDTNNVQSLKVAWVYHTNDADTVGGSQIQCNPIEIDGILYGTSPRLKLFALDAGNGNPKWTFDPFSIYPGTGVQINVNRGVTYWTDGDDKRIFYAVGSYIYAVDAQTGKLVQSFGDSGRVSLQAGLGRDVKNLYVTTTSPGIIFKNLLIMGTRVSETNPAAPGDIRAYDVRSGKIKWIFHTIPRPGEKGNETWNEKDAWEYTGGANSWAGMSLDEKNGIVFIPTGSPTFDFYGGLRKGQNLFANCILALNAATGKLIWYYQTVHHDLWDRDLPAPPNLVTIEYNGKKVEAVAQITKTGYIFLMDRISGKPLFPIHERPVPITPALPGEEPWPTQPVPELPVPFIKQKFTPDDINNLVPDSSQQHIRKLLSQLEPENDMFLPPSEKGTIIFPGFDGGGEWGGAAFDKESGLLYINANQVPWSLTMVRKSSKASAKHVETVAGHGHSVYINNCMACHGVNREGSGNSPSLKNIAGKLSEKDVSEIIENGRRMMPAFKQISGEDKAALLSFLLGLKNGNERFIAQVNKGEKRDNELMPYTMTGYKKIRTPEGYPGNKPPWGTLTAMDLKNGKIRWQIPLGEYPELSQKGIPPTGTENYGGPVLTAGGLLIIAATPDEKIRIFNKRTGQLLWERALPAAGFATPSTYEVNGKQYIVIACGGGKLNARSGDSYVAFALP